MSKLLNNISILAIGLLFVVLPSISMDSLMNGTQSGKSIFFLWGIGIISALAIIRFGLNTGLKTINLTFIDLLLFTFISYILIQNNGAELIHSLLFLELIGLAVLYIIIRQQSYSAYLWLLPAIVLGGTIQAIYENLQLWGYFPSHHGLFRMTGSFFNPGPYSGYLAAVFPVSLGLYLFNVSFQKQNIFTHKINLYFANSLSFFKKIAANTHFFYNNCKGENTSEKQVAEPKHTCYFTMKPFALISIISMCLVLPASRSRAAWLAIVVSSVYLLAIEFKLVQRAKERFKTQISKGSALVLLVILLVIVGAGLYHLKKGSADGRLLIWKTSIEMIKDKPFRGHGYDGFKAHYMNYQAGYFKRHPESKEAFVAGDTNYAFNELIQLTVEYGITGILILLVLLFFLFFGKAGTAYPEGPKEMPIDGNNRSHSSDNASAKQQNTNKPLVIARAVILSVLVFSLFSYPLQILPIKICLTAALAIVAGTSTRKVNLNFQMPVRINRSIAFALKSMVSICLLAVLWGALAQVKLLGTAYVNWKNAFDLYNIGIYNDCLTDYEKAYPALKTNGDFLTNYGKALSMAGKYEQAAEVLEQAAKYYPNTVVYTALGDSYKKMEQTELAEQAYLHAWYMNPSRFYPKYLLAKLYDETGQKTKAIEVARELLAKDIKIESTAIKEIQAEMNEMIEK